MSANALAGRASQLRSLLRSQAGLVAERPTRQCAQHNAASQHPVRAPFFFPALSNVFIDII